MSKRPVILDCDTGLDDAFAIAMAIASDELDVKGVTTVAGNYTLDDVILNTKRVLAVTDPTVPYAIGAAKPIRIPLYTHGHPTDMFDNLGNPDIKPSDLSAVEFMAKILRESDEPVTLVPLGPLTNIAILLLAYPELKEKIGDVVIMGGGVFKGNTTPTAEFNIYVDPEAAYIVFKAGLKLVMCGLEVCDYAKVSKVDAQRLVELGNKTAVQYGNSILESSWDSPTIFDAVPIVYLLKPEIIETQDAYVTIDIDGEHTAGTTVADMRPFFRPDADRPAPNTKVAMKMDNKAYIDLMVELFSNY